MGLHGFHERQHQRLYGGSAKAGLRIVGASRALGALLLLAGFALAGQLAAAEELKIGGELLVGFGRVKSESVGTQGLDGIGEATLNFSAEKGEISAQVEIVLADSNNQFDTVEHELVWSPGKSFSIAISGSALTIPATDGNISIVNASSGPVGDKEVNLDFSGVGLLNIVYAVGPIKIGLALLDNCVPQCGYALDTSTANQVNPDSDLMSAVLHARAEFASITYNAYVSSSSGTFLDSSLDGSGLGGGAGLVFSSGVFRAAVDVSTAIVECSANLGNNACSKDNEENKYGFSINLGGFGLHYYLGKDETESDNTETVNIDAVYLFEMKEGVIGPEYRETVISPANAPSTKDSFLLLGAAVKF